MGPCLSIEVSGNVIRSTRCQINKLALYIFNWLDFATINLWAPSFWRHILWGEVLTPLPLSQAQANFTPYDPVPSQE